MTPQGTDDIGDSGGNGGGGGDSSLRGSDSLPER